MRTCKQCQCSMDVGYVLKADTYGNVKIERGQAKLGKVSAAICPDCGEISLYIENGKEQQL